MTFVLMFCLLRIIYGVGFSFASVANLSIIAKFYPNDVARVVGMFDTFAGVGLIVGPVAGSFLFNIGGFKMPYIVVTICYVVYHICI